MDRGRTTGVHDAVATIFCGTAGASMSLAKRSHGTQLIAVCNVAVAGWSGVKRRRDSEAKVMHDGSRSTWTVRHRRCAAVTVGYDSIYEPAASSSF